MIEVSEDPDQCEERKKMETDYLDHPVFICGHRKTGTTLLINLFDGAKDAVVYTDDSSFFYMYYPRYEAEKFGRDDRLNRLGNLIIQEMFRSLIDRINCDENERAVLYERINKFYHEVMEYKGSDISVCGILPHYIESFRRAFYPETVSAKVWMEKTTSTEIYAKELSVFFPKAKFIHLIRDPRDNWGSLKSGWEKRYKNFNDDIKRLRQSLLERGKLGMEMGRYNAETIGPERYKIVKYEDLVTEPEKVMRHLAEFAGIDYCDNLLRPTQLGFSWGGNNFEGIKHDRPSAVNVETWRKRIEPSEAMLIEFYFRDCMQYFGYPLAFSIEEAQRAATDNYKWFNFSTPFSAK